MQERILHKRVPGKLKILQPIRSAKTVSEGLSKTEKRRSKSKWSMYCMSEEATSVRIKML